MTPLFDSREIKAILDEYGVIVTDNHKSYITHCPLCSKDKKLFFRKTDGRFVCWVCRETEGFQGRPEFALNKITGLPISTLKERLYGSDGKSGSTSVSLDISLQDFYGEDDPVEEVEEIPSMPWAWDAYPITSKEAARGAAYLEGRGISVSVAQEYGIRYQPRSRRVLFPVIMGGRLLGWQGRFVANNKIYTEDGRVVEIPKALSTDDIPRDRTFMFGDRLTGSSYAVLCEGPVDALKAHLCGGNVASMGKAISEKQIKLLKNSGVTKLYLALDPDAAEETSRLVADFAGDLECYWMLPPCPYKDLGEMTMEEVRELFLGAPKVSNANLFVFLKPLY